MRPPTSAYDQALAPTIPPVAIAPIGATAAAAPHRIPHPDAARSPTDHPSAGPPGARTERASDMEGSTMDETARARGLRLCEATAREWRRSACNLRDHAARPLIAAHQALPEIVGLGLQCWALDAPGQGSARLTCQGWRGGPDLVSLLVPARCLPPEMRRSAGAHEFLVAGGLLWTEPAWCGTGEGGA